VKHLLSAARPRRAILLVIASLFAVGAPAVPALAQSAAPAASASAVASVPASAATQASAVTPASEVSAVTKASPSLACNASAIQSALHIPNVTVVSVTPQTSGSYPVPGTTTTLTGLPAFCEVALTQADGHGNTINITVWLPSDWNGRFEGVGGGGYSCGVSYPALGTAIQAGYASASTDCGNHQPDGSFALTSSDQLNWPLITDFASAGIHDMSVTGKAVTTAFYASKPRYSYFNGCSTGGREGLMEAQRYPADYNGIVSGAPAINWTRFIPAEIWPELVMKQSGDYLPTCKEDAFTAAVVKACDPRDGVTDGIISDPADCHWNPATLIGTVTPCGTITATDAAVVVRIWSGPVSTRGSKLWYGLEPGASFDGLAATTTVNGVTGPAPFPISATWLGTWLQQNPSWNWQTLTYAQFDRLFQQSVREFSGVIATDNPNLSQFKRDGGKILIWHGLADQLIFPQGTINYYQRVQQAMGGAKQTDSFARLFLAPGAQHCASAAGPAPANPLAAVASWVEHGQAPTSILATVTDPTTGAVTLSRPLCAYPLTAHYTGHGNPSVASNFYCAPGQP
jgi:feruloyl esterase